VKWTTGNFSGSVRDHFLNAQQGAFDSVGFDYDVGGQRDGFLLFAQPAVVIMLRRGQRQSRRLLHSRHRAPDVFQPLDARVNHRPIEDTEKNLAKRKKAPSTMSRTDCSAMTTSAASNSSPKPKLLRMTIESVAPSTPKSAVTEENQTTCEVRRPPSETAIPRTMRIELL